MSRQTNIVEDLSWVYSYFLPECLPPCISYVFSNDEYLMKDPWGRAAYGAFFMENYVNFYDHDSSDGLYHTVHDNIIMLAHLMEIRWK